MTKWSQSEITRTIEEVKRRAQADPEFRALALSDAAAAIAKVNPRPLPSGITAVFAEAPEAPESRGAAGTVIILPEPLADSEEISDEDLEDAAGGDDGPRLRSC